MGSLPSAGGGDSRSFLRTGSYVASGTDRAGCLAHRAVIVPGGLPLGFRTLLLFQLTSARDRRIVPLTPTPTGSA